MMSMVPVIAVRADKRPEYAYHLLRGALNLFKRSVPELTEEQRGEAERMANRSFALESLVLASPEAMGIAVPDSAIANAVFEIESRYENRTSFIQDLRNNGLDEDILRNALVRELMFNAVMERVSSKTPAVSELDIQIFYQLHTDRFMRQETRKARHILVTLNQDYPENTFDNAVQRLQPLVTKLRRNPGRFKDLARKHSECPTALDGGKLGELTAGKLYPELDTALFEMQEGGISDIIETEMGLHILYCEKINKPVRVPLSRVKRKIRAILEQRQRRACQKAWLDKLQEEHA
jgi:peptidyl-prolyl cis-trans isomerase C